MKPSTSRKNTIIQPPYIPPSHTTTSDNDSGCVYLLLKAIIRCINTARLGGYLKQVELVGAKNITSDKNYSYYRLGVLQGRKIAAQAFEMLADTLHWLHGERCHGPSPSDIVNSGGSSSGGGSRTVNCSGSKGGSGSSSMQSCEEEEEEEEGSFSTVGKNNKRINTNNNFTTVTNTSGRRSSTKKRKSSSTGGSSGIGHLDWMRAASAAYEFATKLLEGNLAMISSSQDVSSEPLPLLDTYLEDTHTTLQRLKNRFSHHKSCS